LAGFVGATPRGNVTAVASSRVPSAQQGHWTLLTTATSESIIGLACPSVTICYATAAHGTIMKTMDGGATWQTQNNPFKPKYDIAGIACPTVTICYAGAYSNSILGTKDGGKTWILQYDGLIQHYFDTDDTEIDQDYRFQDLYGVSCTDATHCLVVGTAGHVYRTTDGVTWTKQTGTATHAVLANVQCQGSGVCYAVGGYPCIPGYACIFYAGAMSGGAIVRSSDGGSNWQGLGNEPALFGISCPTAKMCLAVGEAADFTRTTNGGASWSSPLRYVFKGIDPHTAVFGSVACVSARVCRVTGWAGTRGVLMRTDGDRSWQEEATPDLTNIALGRIACPATTTCYVGASGGAILKGA
jgi:photosystem II stability/assembly factor-like uncharacterized protein